MDILVTKELINILMISITLSIIVMATIQKIKNLTFIKQRNVVWLINLVLSFGIGIPFSLYFYKTGIFGSLWISFFTFVGAPTIYQTLKKQNIINYTPKSSKDNCINKGDNVIISKLNVIKRDDVV